MAKEKGEHTKKPIYKKWWFWVIIAVIALGGSSSLGGEDNSKPTDNPEATEQTEEAAEETNEAEASKDAIILEAGVLGEYGKEIVMNEGTDSPENLIVYYLPDGDYTVKNVGEYPTQVNVYEGFKRDESTGYDDYTDGSSTPMIDVEGTADITIPDGWFIEIHEPTVIELVKK